MTRKAVSWPQELFLGMPEKLVNIKGNFVTISHYKEPLLEIPEGKGFGYYGCLLGTPDGEKVMCAICGGLFRNLAMHVYQTHDMRVREYREQFQLERQTALISETYRQEMKERTLAYMASLSPEGLAAMKENAKAAYKVWRAKNPNSQFKERLEAKNKKGTCPDQLIAKIKEIAASLRHTPTLAEFITETGGQRFKHLIYATFGSWSNALKIAELTPEPKKVSKWKRYTDEQLLEYLSLYAREHNKIPTATDCKRGFLPYYEVYKRHFGSFPRARDLAGIASILN